MSPARYERKQLMDALGSRFNPQFAPELAGIFEFQLREAPELDFHMVVEGDGFRLSPGRHPQPDIRLGMTPADYFEVFRADLTQLFAQGRLTVEGDLRLGLILANMLQAQPEEDWHPDPAAIERASPRAGELRSIEKRSLGSISDFQAEFAFPGRPVVVTDAMQDWGASALTLPLLKERFGHVRVVPRIGDYVSTAFTTQRAYSQMSLAEYFERMAASENQGEAPPYVGNNPVPDELMPWIGTPPFFASSGTKRPSLWLGPGGTVTPLHRDLLDNALAQVLGSKQLLLFSPDQSRWLYTWESSEVLQGSRVDPEHPDLERFPLFRDASPLRLTLAAGEMLYLPAGWFHHVRSLSPSMSVNYFQFQREPAVMRRPAPERG